jgi:hypothetical protein
MTGFRKTGLLAANAFFATAWGATEYFCEFFTRRQNAGSSRQHRETLPAAGPNEIRQDAGSTQATTRATSFFDFMVNFGFRRAVLTKPYPCIKNTEKRGGAKNAEGTPSWG